MTLGDYLFFLSILFYHIHVTKQHPWNDVRKKILLKYKQMKLKCWGREVKLYMVRRKNKSFLMCDCQMAVHGFSKLCWTSWNIHTYFQNYSGEFDLILQGSKILNLAHSIENQPKVCLFRATSEWWKWHCNITVLMLICPLLPPPPMVTVVY